MPFAKSVAAVERWLLPGECLACRERGPTDDLICRVCQSRWRPIPHPRCERCGQPADPHRACPICPEWPSGLARVESLVWLDDGARMAVHALKYHGWWRVAESMAAGMARLIPRGPGPTMVLVPVPLGPSRLKDRGYNQSGKLALALAARTGSAVNEALLARVRDTKSQTTLTPDQRAANLEGAFRVHSPVAERIVLVDDVFTTGATLLSAAKALLAHGAVRVDGVTFARAELPLAGLARTV